MTGRAAFLVLLLICVASGAEENSGLMRKASCPNMEIAACPLNMAPVCGSDGNTYANECALCVQRQATKMEILIAKEESC